MSSASSYKYSCRKWFGVLLLLIELFTASATIYGFSALFTVLANNGVYDTYCTSSPGTNWTTSTQIGCKGQTKQYENAVTLGITIYDLTSALVGVSVDVLGARAVKLTATSSHVIGWLALALMKPGRDYLLYVHTAFTSLSGTMVAITAYASCSYFSKSRAFLSSLFVGANIAAAVWYSIFQVLIDAGHVTLAQLSYIWMSLGLLMLITSFLNLDWKFHWLNLPYQFDTTLEESMTHTEDVTVVKDTKSKWYERIYRRTGIWKHLTSPLYILLVLFLTMLFTPTNLLSITWYPWVYHITNHNTTLADQYTFAYNMSALASIIICPINGFLLGFGADRSRAQKMLNISISQTVTWLLNIMTCILCLFVTRNIIIPVLVFNCIAHATIEAGTQAIVSTCFPSKYTGTLSGVMWTVTGLFTLTQYGLVDLTEDIHMSWRAWLILLILMTLMSSHLVQIWSKYVKERKYPVSNTQQTKS